MKASKSSNTKSPWYFVPTLYYAEGIPYIIAMTVSVIFYKKMGVSNADIALYTSWLYLPWVIKPIWSPIVDILKTKRFWILTMQLVIGAGLASVAFVIPLPNYFQLTLAFFWLLAFSSATHDVAVDGFYMLALNQRQQAWFVGVRSTFYRFAMLTGQGLLVILAGYLESSTGLPPVEITTKAVQSEQHAVFVQPDSLKIIPVKGELQVIHFPGSLQIPLGTASKKHIEKFVTTIQAWNSGKSIVWDSVRTNLKSEPLNKADIAGNIGVILIYLSGPPKQDEKIVVNLSRSGGDKSFSLLTGGRFEFTAEDWNRPRYAVIQLDPRLREPSRAEFTATAGNVPLSWMITFSVMAIFFLIIFLYHKFILPQPVEDAPRRPQSFFKDYFKTFVVFFKKDHIGIALAFLLLYRLAEAQLVKLASPFLLDTQDVGGLGLTTGQLGFVYGTVGLIMLTIGGLLGGFLAAKYGLKKLIWWMVIAINLPDAVYVYLAHFQTNNFLMVNLAVGIEQFGYGFGFTAYMLYQIYISRGEYRTAHFAITTGFMALGMMLPGMVSGWIQELIGYEKFFIWVLICALPGILLIKFLPIDPEFGKKETS